jgi:hypothetical protein
MNMAKHAKTARPSDADLKRNPLIGAGKAATMAQATPEDAEEAEGQNTVKGDVLNDVNPQGGIDKAGARNSHRKPNSDRGG